MTVQGWKITVETGSAGPWHLSPVDVQARRWAHRRADAIPESAAVREEQVHRDDQGWWTETRDTVDWRVVPIAVQCPRQLMPR